MGLLSPGFSSYSALNGPDITLELWPAYSTVWRRHLLTGYLPIVWARSCGTDVF